MKYEIKENKLTINGNQSIKFKYNVKNVVEVNNTIIVLLDIPPKESMSENIFAISDEGQILWQIEPRKDSTKNDPDDVYVGLHYINQDEIKAFHWQGLAVVVDTFTGKIKSVLVTK